MDEDQIVFLDCENGDSDTSTASSSTCTSETNFKPVSTQGILSFLKEMDEIYSKEQDEGKLIRELIAAANFETKTLECLAHCLSAFFKEIVSRVVKNNHEKREMKLEKRFNEMRCSGLHYVNVNKVWHQVCFQQSAYSLHCRNSVLQLIIQHFWASGCKISKIHHNKSTAFHTFMTKPDKTETQSILYHAGWAIKRARDVISKGPTGNLELKKTTNEDSAIVVAEKTTSLAIIKQLGDDVLQHDGTYKYVVHEKASPLFVFLHHRVHDYLIKNLTSEQGEVLKECLHSLSFDENLRKSWFNLIGSSWDLKASIVVLQRIVTFFVKSKQQIFREKEGIKPSKNSVSLRGGLVAEKLKKKITKKKLTMSEEVTKMRANATPESVAKFLQHLHTLPQPTKHDLLNQLTGKELAKLLKTQGKPALQGKKKEKQILSLIETL